MKSMMKKALKEKYTSEIGKIREKEKKKV